MNPIIVVPYFGTDPRYLTLLDRWVAQFFISGCKCPLAIISDLTSPCPYPVRRFDLSGYSEVMRNDQPFDRKGALMCEAILNLSPCLILDADALLMSDPSPHLQDYAGLIAQPLDLGAGMDNRKKLLSWPYGDVAKTNGGVLWSGDTAAASTLVREYRANFVELRSREMLPWSPQLPCLIEQFSWSIALHRLGGSYLPQTFNWPRHVAPHNPDAVINHYFGGRKFKV